MSDAQVTAEHARLAESASPEADWRVWGPYVSGRQWGSVREDYSADGDAWSSFPFEQAHTRAYRWGEDGIAGLSDRYGFLNLGLALWNGKDDRLKERYFGLTGPQGNHGEDVKEYWWHLDATPTHSYAAHLYRYPQAAFPYADLRARNAERSRADDEYELTDTKILDGDRFFDVVTRHAKQGPFDIVIEITATNHGPDPAPLDVVPHVWFRNTWSWGRDDRKPNLRPGETVDGQFRTVILEHAWLGKYHLVAEGNPDLLVCDNETNERTAFGATSTGAAHPKDAINEAIVHGDTSLLAAYGGTKAALRWHHDAIAPGESVTVRLRLVRDDVEDPWDGRGLLDAVPGILAARQQEADAFHAAVVPAGTSDEDAFVARRAFAGLLWCKQVYRYDVAQWLDGDPTQPPPPPERRARGERNTAWRHLMLADVISMPDEWEYPWFASWDLAFHCVALAHIDPAFAKHQLLLMCREWAMHSNGQLPAYEWDFGDVNPPVHAWAAWHVYRLDGASDQEFLVRIFTKLLLNFGWWVNRKDAEGSNLFEGGFLGMDNIGPFDRSKPLAGGQRLEQADATSWMAMYCLNLLRIAWELARHDPAWDEIATKFLEHYLAIAEAMEHFGTGSISLWDETDGFYYDAVVSPDDETCQLLRVRTMVGLLPLLAVAVEPTWVEGELADFSERLSWLLSRRPELAGAVVHTDFHGTPGTTFSLVSAEQLHRILQRVLDEGEFLSPHGIRSVSAAYRGGGTVSLDGQELPISYDPAESRSALFGGNSNWRGPVWFPVNVLLTDALRTYAADMEREFTVEFPTGSGRHLQLVDVPGALEDRLVGLFRLGPDGRRPSDPIHVPTGALWGQAHPTFSEYFHGDTGAGLGASHQTGWTAMVAHLICTRDHGEDQP